MNKKKQERILKRLKKEMPKRLKAMRDRALSRDKKREKEEK